jgi:hypothetical protein
VIVDGGDDDGSDDDGGNGGAMMMTVPVAIAVVVINDANGNEQWNLCARVLRSCCMRARVCVCMA